MDLVGVCNALVTKRPLKSVRTFDEIDSAGTDLSFRCPDCRNSQNCQNCQRIDVNRIQEEIEQDLISRSSASLPLVTNPDTRIDSDSKERLALKINESQVGELDNRPEDKSGALLSESELQDLGLVDYFDNLPYEIRSKVRYLIPWGIVFNGNSVSTLCRLVQYSSNSLLCQGRNDLNNLVMIIKAVCLSKGKWPKKPNSDKLLQFDSVSDSSGIYDTKGLDSLKILVVEESVTFTSHFPVVTGIVKN